MADLTLAVDTSLARDLFASLNYPYRMRVGSKVIEEPEPGRTDTDQAEMEWDADPGSTPEDEIADFDAVPLLEATVQAFLEQHRSDRYLSDEEDREASALVAPYAEGIDSDRSESVKAVLDRMAADAAFEAKAKAFLKSRLGSGVEWVEAELSQRPDVAMGNPLTLSGLRFAVRARLKGCIRVFGREICVTVTTPWIRFEGRRAALFLDVVGQKVYGRARVSNIDFVWKIRIWKWTVTIRVGVTGLINGQLAHQRPLLADFGTVAIAVPGVSRTYHPTAVAIPPSSSETKLQIDGDFTA
ncbi:MAG: hypothetical protein ACKOOL_07325 [Novosphingobium sp.]